MNKFDHLLSPANWAGPLPSSLLYYQIENPVVGFAETAGFQEEWFEVACEMWGTPKVVGSSVRFVAAPIQL